MSSKRRQSGSRLPSASKSKAQPHARNVYEITFYTPDGDLLKPDDEQYRAKVARFKEICPQLAAKFEEGSLDVGLQPGSWQYNSWQILDSIMKNTKRSKWFLNPVNPKAENLPDYFTVIKNPMDLGTIKTRLLNSYYDDAHQFADSVRLTFDNAMKYNPVGSLPHDDASKLLSLVSVRPYCSLPRSPSPTQLALSRASSLNLPSRALALLLALRLSSPPLPHPSDWLIRPVFSRGVQFERKFAPLSAPAELAAGEPRTGADGASSVNAGLDDEPSLVGQPSFAKLDPGESGDGAPGGAAAGGEALGSGPAAAGAVDDDDDDWGDDFDEPGAAEDQGLKEVVSDEDDDEDDDDNDGEDAAGTSGAVGGKAPQGAVGGKAPQGAASFDDDDDDDGMRPSVGGKAPPEHPRTGGKGVPTAGSADETSEADLSDSAMGSEMGQSEMDDDDVSEADMFGDDDDGLDGDGDGGFGDEEGDSQFESEFEGDDGTGGGGSSTLEGESSVAEGGEDETDGDEYGYGGGGDPDDSVNEEEGDDD